MSRRVRLTSGTELVVLPWDEFGELFRREHKQGEHVSIVGPTGSGKTVLELELARIIGSRRARDNRPARVVVLAVKPRDRTLAGLGWPTVREWPPAYGEEHCIVWPRSSDPHTRAQRQREVFEPLLRVIFQEGGQTVVIDEAAYFERRQPEGLGLSHVLTQYWESARSLDLTLIAATQRPRRVSRSMWSEPAWVFVFPPDDLDDLKRVAELTGRKTDVLEVAPELDDYEFLVLRRAPGGRRRHLYVSRVGA